MENQTTAPTSAPTLVQIDKELQDSLANLAAKHVTVSYTLVGILLVVLCFGAFGAYFAAKWVDKEVAQAQSAEKLFNQEQQTATMANQQYQQELASHNADRIQWAAQQVQLVQAYSTHNQVVTQQIKQVTQAGKSAQDAFADIHDAYKDNLTVSSASPQVSVDPASGEQMLAFPVSVVQQFTATKLDDDLQTANVANLDQQLSLEKQTNSTLTTDIAASQDDLTKQKAATQACSVALNDYKKVVVVSKFKKIMSGALKGVLFAGGIVIGHYL